MKKWIPAVMGLCLLLGLTISLRAASAPTAAEKRRQAIEAQLKSGKVDQVNLGYADMLKWFDENIADAESSFWFDRVAIVGVPAHAQETLALIERSKEYKKKVAMLRDIGYLYAMQAAMLYQMDRSAEAMAALQEGLTVDLNATTTESLSYLPRILTARKAFTELADALDALVTGRPQDAASVESTLKQRIALFNQLGKFDAALADAKRLFDVSTMDHTRDAITVLDKQLTVSHIADPSVVSAFRKEQTEGAAAPGPDESPHTSAVVLGITVDSARYDALLQVADDGTFAGLLRHALLYLVADRPSDALALAQNALETTTDANDAKVARDVVARCFKAQDGTVGRANAWLAQAIAQANVARRNTSGAGGGAGAGGAKSGSTLPLLGWAAVLLGLAGAGWYALRWWQARAR